MKSYLNDYKLLTGCDQPIKIQTHNKNRPNSSNLRLIINAIRINGYVTIRPRPMLSFYLCQYFHDYLRQNNSNSSIAACS